MASHVIIVSPTARSTKINTQPGTYLNDVLQEACQKWNLKPENYVLKHSNKVVDLSRTIRLSGLPQGAKLEIVQGSRSPTVVNVALQLPEGNARLTKRLPSNTTLWQVLRVFETGQAETTTPYPPTNLNLTQRAAPAMSGSGGTGAGRLHYEMPVLQIMQREVSSFSGLQQTLGQLGFSSGSCLLRLSFKNSGQPLEEAMAERSQFFRDVEGSTTSTTEARGAHAEMAGQSIPDSDNPNGGQPEAIAGEPNPPDSSDMEDVQPTPESSALPSTAAARERMDTPTTETNEVPDNTVVGPLSRPMRVFAPPSSSTPQAASFAHNERDYEFGIEHAKMIQAQLKEGGQNKRLESDKEIEAKEQERQERLAAVRELTFRIRFPDQSSVEASFGKTQTAVDVYEFVKSLIRHPKAAFSLRYMGNKGQTTMAERPQELVRDLKFTGQTLLTFVWEAAASQDERRPPTLLEQYTRQWQARKVEAPANEPAPAAESSGAKPDDKGKGKQVMSAADKESKLKKMLGGGLFKKK